MVNLSKLEALALQLNEKERLAIAGLIDLKTEDDMDKVLNKLDAIESKFDAKFDTIESKFDAKFDAVDAKFDTLERRFSDFRWFIGGGFTLIGILITALKLY